MRNNVLKCMLAIMLLFGMQVTFAKEVTSNSESVIQHSETLTTMIQNNGPVVVGIIRNYDNNGNLISVTFVYSDGSFVTVLD